MTPSRALALVLAATCSSLVAPQVCAAGNLLTNGSFETPSIAGSSYVTYAPGSTVITGWTVIGAGETQLTRTEFLPAAHGMQWIDLTGIVGYGKGLLSDAVNTTPGTTYQLSFDVGDYYAAGFGNATVAVSINDGPRRLFTNVYTAGVMDWERKSLTWVADSSHTRISLLGVENGSLSNNWGIGLDNVVLEAAPVPEPASAALMLAGAAGLGLLARRRGRARGAPAA